MAENRYPRRGLHDLQVIVYVCSFLKLTRPHIQNPLIYAAAAARSNCAKLSVKVQRLSLRAFQSKVRPFGSEFDLNSVVLVSPKTAVYLSVRNCQWLNVKCFIRNAEGQALNSSHRWIILRISPEVPDDICVVSPILYHNLVQNNHGQDVMIEFVNDFQYVMSSAFQKILVLWHNAHNAGAPMTDDVNIQNGPQYASEVHVKYVESLKYKCGSYLETVINDHFSIPKAVSKNDILVIPLPSHIAYEFANINSVVPPKNVFIQVSAVKGKSGSETRQTMLVNKGVTSLYLSGAARCLLPSLMEVHPGSGESGIPPILANSCKTFKSVMEMEMKSKQKELFACDLNMQVCADCKEWKDLSGTSSPSEKGAKDITQVKQKESSYNEGGAMHSASVLFLGQPGSGIESVVDLAASDLGLEVLWTDCWHLKGDTSGATEARIRQTFLRAATQSPCVLALKNVHCLTKDSDGNDECRAISALKEEVLKLQQSSVILAATAPDRAEVSADLWSIWSHQETVEVPNLFQRSLMLDWLFSIWVPKDKIQTLAQRTAGYIFGDFQALFSAAQRLCLHRLLLSQEEETSDIAGTSSGIPPLTYDDLLNALDELQSNRSKALGAPRIPQVHWKEVGGLEDAKREIVNTIQLPLRHPSLISSGLRRSGVLLYGPPGTGKTLLAKAVATECGLNFMSVKGPELLNMYVGQSEENVRQVFARARAAAPCIIFFDELDSLAPNRGRSGDSGGVMDRIVSALLAELDGVANSADVFVLAATNRPDLIDPALLRPGRFEKLVYLGVCEDRDAQVKILRAVTSKVPLAEDVSLEHVAELLPLTLTGADLYALCTDALYIALHRTTEDIISGKVKEDDAEILVQEKDFKAAADQLVPSVTPQELVHYQNLKTNKK